MIFLNLLNFNVSQWYDELSKDVSLWIILIIAFLIIEAGTVTLLTVWFAAGAVVSAVLAALGVPFGWQVAIFFIVSIILLLTARPMFNRLLKQKTSTNKDSLIGKQTFVTEKIDNLSQCGYVKINGVYWTARSMDNSIIDCGELVEIKEIQGNKLIVCRTNKA